MKIKYGGGPDEAAVFVSGRWAVELVNEGYQGLIERNGLSDEDLAAVDRYQRMNSIDDLGQPADRVSIDDQDELRIAQMGLRGIMRASSKDPYAWLPFSRYHRSRQLLRAIGATLAEGLGV